MSNWKQQHTKVYGRMSMERGMRYIMAKAKRFANAMVALVPVLVEAFDLGDMELW